MTVAELSRRRGGDLMLGRLIAAYVDMGALAGIVVGPAGALSAAAYSAILPLLLLIAVSYYPVLEGLTGRTLGRRVTRTIVVDAEGNLTGVRSTDTSRLICRAHPPSAIPE